MAAEGLTSVLYVEDDEQVVDAVSVAFEGEFDLTVVSSSEEALKVIQSRSFDVIISDYLMPKMNGIEFLSLLRSGPLKTVPFILFTGKVSEEIANQVADREYFYYVSKGTAGIEGLVYAVKDAAVRKRAVDFPAIVFKKLQLLNGTILHDWNNNDLATGAYVSIIEEGADTDSIRVLCEKIATIQKKNLKLREESKIIHQVGAVNNWFLLRETLFKVREDFKDFIFINEIPEDIEIFANPTVFSIVANILLDNSGRHGQRVSEIHLSFAKRGKNAVFSYRDNGVGVVPENKSRIFDRRVGENSGWGLYLAKEIMNLFGGDIVESGTLGEGACFEIIIPFCLYRHGLKKE